MQIVSGQEPCGEDLAGDEEMTQVGAREARAGGTGASRLERPLVVAMAGVPDRDAPARDERHAVAGVPRRQDAIEEVESHGSELYQLVGCSDPHEIARTVGGKVGKSLTGHVERTVPALADRQASHGISIESDVGKRGGAPGAQRGVEPTLDDREDLLVGAGARGP